MSTTRAIRLAWCAGITLLAVLPACDRAAPTERSDAEVQPRTALRIIAASPAVAEICCALGLREQLVGRSSYCTWPPAIESVPSIGGLVDLNTESLLALRPTLVLLSGNSQAQRDRLDPLGLHVESVPDTSLEDIFTAIERIGELTSRGPQASRLAERIRGELSEIDQRVGQARRQRVLIVLGPLADPPQPPITAGPASFLDDLLRRTGIANIARDAPRPYAPISLEAIVNADPDVIIELDADGTRRPGGDADALRAWSHLGQLRAVRNCRVHVLTGRVYFIPGPRVARVYGDLVSALRDELPRDVAPASTTQP